MSRNESARPPARRRLGQAGQILAATVVLAIVLGGMSWLHRARQADPTPVDVDRTGFQFEFQDKTIRVDEFIPEGTGRRPTVFLLHGSGGLGAGVMDTARDLARHGYVALVLHYFDLPGVQISSAENSDRYFRDWMALIGDAMKAAGKRPHVDPGRTGLLGYSLGGYLALEVGATNPDVAAVVDYFGGMATVISDKLERMPPTLLLHGERDPIVPVAEARRLQRLFKQKNITFEIQVYPDQGHGFSGDAATDARQRTLRFLDKYLAGK
jgi:carboxymethylenebutenolidase